MCSSGGELFIKPCTEAEANFYDVARSQYPEFYEIMPVHIGRLSLGVPEQVKDAVAEAISPNGDIQVGTDAIVASVANLTPTAPIAAPASNTHWEPNNKSIKTDISVVLENIAHGFSKANILDAKLGGRLWADNALEAKKKRFDQITQTTTHGSLGFRIAGMKVYRGSDAEEDSVDGYKVYDKDYGRVHVNDDNVLDAFRSFVFNKAAGIDMELGRAVCKIFARDLKTVIKIMKKYPTRMFSTSLLFVFEGDGKKLREAIEQTMATKPIERTNHRVDSGIVLEDDEDEEVQVYDDDDDDDSDLDSLSSAPRIYSLKLIDFAHAKWTPTEEPDENIIKGVRSLRDIFEKLAK